MLATWIAYNVYYFHPAIFDWKVSLPLHVCDLLGLVSAAALATNSRTARAILYFCAIPLAGQALVTPSGNQDPNTLRFWLYWLLHGGIIAFSIFDMAARHFQPTWADLRRVLILDVFYALIVTPANMAFNWNYGYLGNSLPASNSILDFLGPWPQRILVVLILVGTLQFLMFVPWIFYRLTKNKDRV